MTELLLEAAGQPWIYAAVVLGCLIDGFFPPIPSEALVVGMASLAAAHGGHGLWLLLLAALLGAFLGDNAAYALGRRLGTSRFKWMRRPLMQRSFAKAGQGLEGRAVSMILVARFLPGARVAVNLTAGATGFRRRKFIAISALSAFLWASYSVLIGALAGVWLREHPFLGFVAAIILAATIGLVLDLVINKIRARSRNRSTKRRAGTQQSGLLGGSSAQHESPRESVGAA